MPHVVLPGAWSAYTGGVRHVDLPAGDVDVLVHTLRARFPGLAGWLDNGAGQVPEYTNIFVGDLDVRMLGDPPARLSGDDEVRFVVEMPGG